MSEFSDLLGDYIHERGKTIRGIAKELNISQNTLIKICNGTRNPHNHEKTINQIYDLLMLEPRQRSRLGDAFEQQAGKNSYMIREKIVSTLQNVTETPRLEFAPMTVAALPESMATLRKGDTMQLINDFIINSARTTNHIMDMMASLDDPEICLSMKNVLASLEINVRHLVQMEISAQQGDDCAVKNVRAACDALTLSLAAKPTKTHYQAYYCYTKGSSGSDGQMTFPNIMLSTKGTLLCTSDYTHAIFTQDKNINQYFAREFQVALHDAKPLTSTPQNLLEEVSRNVQCMCSAGESDALMVVEWQPCFFYFIQESELKAIGKKYLDTAGPLLESYYKNYVPAMKSRKNFSCYFCLDGFMDFLVTGILAELPKQFSDCVTPLELRVVLIDRVMSAARKKQINLRMLKQSYFSLPEGLQLLSFGANTIEVSYRPHRRNACLFFMEEANTNLAMLEFMEHLDSERCSYTLEETCDILQEQLDRYLAGVNEDKQ